MPRLTHPFVVLLLALAALLPFSRTSQAANTVPTGFTDEVLIGSGLTQPRAFTLLPDGRILVLEQRTGMVRLIVGTHIAATNPVFTLPNVNSSGYERGAQGIAVDPQFPTRPFVYFAYNDLDLNMHLVRYTVTGSVSDPLGEALTFGARRELISDFYYPGPNHNSGCLRFGPDGMLYASFGENDLGCPAQDPTLARGCILRLDTSRIPLTAGPQVPRALLIPTAPSAPNPLVTPDSLAKLVWAYGLRNPWIFGMDRATGTIYSADVGEATQEEVDEILPGRNYGWPFREGYTVQTNPNCLEPGGFGNSANAYTEPMIAFNRDGALHAVFCAGIYRAVQPTATTKNWPPEYRGNVWYGDYYVGDLIRLKRDPVTDVWQRAEAVPGMADTAWARGLFGATDFNEGPDGSLYYSQQFNSTFTGATGSLHRIVYNGSQVGVPTETASAVRLACAPDPFVAHAELSFTLPAGGHASLALYDLLGRRVATLFDGQANAGETRVNWDGADSRGGRAAAGVYMARLQTAGVTKTLRVLRVQ